MTARGRLRVRRRLPAERQRTGTLGNVTFP